MEDVTSFFQNIYQNFNNRNIDFVIANMTGDVLWANGMDGGYVYGHDGVRAYWTKQFGILSSNVTPLDIKEENDAVNITVHQVTHDVNGNLLADEMVTHVFYLKDGRIAKFDIGEKP